MQKKTIVFACVGVMWTCVALIPVLLGIGAVTWDESPIPVALWITLALAFLMMLAAVLAKGR